MAFYYQGTVTPKGLDKFNAEEAANGLKEAMRGLGTDEKAIINILCEHANYERQQIKTMYKTMYGADLADDLRDELSGNFETLCLYLLVPSREFDALRLKKAMTGVGTDEDTLIEILTSRSNHEISEIKEQYKKKYNNTLEEDIESDTSGHLRKILVSLLQGNRSEEEIVDNDLVMKDAKELVEAGAKSIGTDESIFNKILAVRSFTHLKEVFDAYAKLDNQGIEGAIKSETSGDLQKAYLNIVQCVYNKLPHFAECFYKCLKGVGTDDDKLMQLVVSHSEIDLLSISECYLNMYKKSLPRMVESDTSGDYKKLLMKLVNPK